MMTLCDELNACVKDIADFPKPGVMFKDVMPLFLNAPLFKKTIVELAKEIKKYAPTHLVGMESRGFLFAVPLAYELGASFVPARKKGKLPGSVVSQEYSLEYGTDVIEVQAAAVVPGGRYFIVDDVLATGGTALAVNKIFERLNCSVVGNLFLIELEFLAGRGKLLEKYPQLEVMSCLKY